MTAIVAVENEGLVPALSECNRIFDAINQQYFDSSMPIPVFTIQSAGRKKGVLGWCTTTKMWIDKDDRDNKRFEINLVAEAMTRPVSDIFETILHEVAHYANWYNGIRDCNAAQYHNQKFKSRAESLGLIVKSEREIVVEQYREKGQELTPEQIKKIPVGRGFAYTHLGPQAEEFMNSINIDQDAFRFARVEANKAAKAPTKMKKWTCACGINIRAAVEIDVTCNICGELFELQE